MAGEGTRGRIRVARMGPRKYHRDALRAKDYKRWAGRVSRSRAMACEGHSIIMSRKEGHDHV